MLGAVVFENTTPAAQRAIATAAKESRTWQQMDTEHMLLGLIADIDGVAGGALAVYGVTEFMVRHEIESLLGDPKAVAGDVAPKTRDFKRLIELSREEASQFKVQLTDTPHILLALTRMAQPQAVGYVVLLKLLDYQGVAELQEHVIDQLLLSEAAKFHELANGDPAEGSVR